MQLCVCMYEPPPPPPSGLGLLFQLEFGIVALFKVALTHCRYGAYQHTGVVMVLGIHVGVINYLHEGENKENKVD